jgi:hypothetical protein
MQSVAFDTFNGANTHISFVGMVSKDRAASFIEASPSNALKKAGAEFAAIADDRETGKSAGGSADDRLASVRALLARSKTTSVMLGEEVFGAESPNRNKETVGDAGIIALAAKIAVEKFGNPTGTVGTAEPSPQATPAQIVASINKNRS